MRPVAAGSEWAPVMANSIQSRARSVFESLTLIRLSILLVVMLILLVFAAGFSRVREAGIEYQRAVDQIEQIQALASSDEIYSLSQEDMSWLGSEFATLQQRIDHIEDLSNLPFGLDGAIGSAPWLAPRYDAAMETLEVGRLLAEAGQVIASIGEEAMIALDATGIRNEEGEEGETWLDILQLRESDLNESLAKMDQAIDRRGDIQEQYLPSGILFRLHQIDAVLERFASQRELANDLPLAFEALGAERSVRYLVLFQNPAEIRPTGGFVGTIAFVEIERGQIVQYEFHDVYEISQDYQRVSDDGPNPPWAISAYVRPDKLQFQDANWWLNFPDTARVYMNMTNAAGWGVVDSVVAVQPEAITNLIEITGPISIEVQGETRVVTAENLEEEAERQRRLEREGQQIEVGHKEVISLIGEVLVDHLSQGERDDLIDAAFLMFDALDRRDMQAYHSSEGVQAFLEERNWAGLSAPEPGTPTIATAFANVTGLKTSQFMQPEMRLEFLESSTEDVTEALLTISMAHFGDENEDPFYEGFQRWWLDVQLPEGTGVVDRMPAPAPDPDMSNGGAFMINLDVGERRDVTIRYTTPDADRILLRRQPGVLPVIVEIHQFGCDEVLEFVLDQDRAVVFSGDCAELEEIEPDVYSNGERRLNDEDRPTAP
jgi:hypothetical protein